MLEQSREQERQEAYGQEMQKMEEQKKAEAVRKAEEEAHNKAEAEIKAKKEREEKERVEGVKAEAHAMAEEEIETISQENIEDEKKKYEMKQNYLKSKQVYKEKQKKTLEAAAQKLMDKERRDNEENGIFEPIVVPLNQTAVNATLNATLNATMNATKTVPHPTIKQAQATALEMLVQKDKVDNKTI